MAEPLDYELGVKRVEITTSTFTQASGSALPAQAAVIAGEDGGNARIPKVSATGTSSDGFAAGAYSMYQVAQQVGFNGTSWDRVRVMNLKKYVSNGALAAAATLGIWTPASGKKFRLHGLVISVATAGTYIIQDGATNLMALYMPANATQVVPLAQNGYLSAAANNVLQVLNNGSGPATIAVTAWGNEE